MKPSLGRIVLTLVAPETNNGADVAPAIITRVWSDTCVNIRTLNDSMNSEWKTSVYLEADEEAARARGGLRVAYWPPRV